MLCLGATGAFSPPPGFSSMDIVQGFRPDLLELRRRGLEAGPEARGEGYDLAIVLSGRHRGQNELRIATALRRTAPGATVVVSGTKEEGIASLSRRIAALTPLEGRLSKFHSQVFWFRAGNDRADIAAALEQPNGRVLVEGLFETAPGMFSHGEVDRGSRLLAENLPDLAGELADFCAGWGFLAAEAMRRCPRLSRVDLFEADYDALEAARRNLARLDERRPARFFWIDLLSEEVPGRYDVIMMNPPFHRSRRAEPDLGRRLIEVAARALKSRGRLIVVANRTLPYEAVLENLYARRHALAEDGSFKVLLAER